MRKKLRRLQETRRGQYLIEAINWSPAIVFFGLYIASENLLFLTYAMAFALWQQFKVLHRLRL